MNSACGQRALFALVTPRCLSPVLERVSVTTCHNDPARLAPANVNSGTPNVLDLAEEHERVYVTIPGEGS